MTGDAGAGLGGAGAGAGAGLGEGDEGGDDGELAGGFALGVVLDEELEGGVLADAPEVVVVGAVDANFAARDPHPASAKVKMTKTMTNEERRRLNENIAGPHC